MRHLPRVLLISIGLACGACAAAVSGGAPPIWRTNLAHLEQDKAAVRSCLAGASEALDQCRAVVQGACRGHRPPSAEDMARDEELTWLPSQARQCDWRAIAAWEDIMAETLDALSRDHHQRDLTASQRAWETSMLADVAYAASEYEGGSLEGPMAAAERAEAVARRVIWLERRRRDG